MKKILFKRILISLFAFLFVCFGFAAYQIAKAATENSGSGITVGPPVVEYTVSPGQTINGTVKVNDYNQSPVTLYPQAYDFSAKDETGQPQFLESDPNYKFSLSKWIKFSPEPVSLAVGELRPIQYQISVPKDAEPGGHYGVIFFSTKAPEEVKEGEAKVITNIKVGQLILVTVPGAIKEDAAIATFKTKHYLNFFPVIQYSSEKFLTFSQNIDLITRIQNNGNIHFKPKGIIEIKNLFGQKMTTETVNSDKGNVLPDSIRKFENTWKAKWWQFGYFKANLDLTYGQNNSGLQKSVSFWVIPWWLLVIIIILVLYIWRKIKKKKKAKIFPQS